MKLWYFELDFQFFCKSFDSISFITSDAILQETGFPPKELKNSIPLLNFSEIELNKATEYAAEDADVTLRLYTHLKSRLDEEKLNKVYEGKVVKIVDFCAFVNILPGKDGLLHVSEISSDRVENVSDVLSEGDII